MSYPPPQGYPPPQQGYPQAQGHPPPAQPGYAPQAGGYPPQQPYGAPGQGYPAQQQPAGYNYGQPPVSQPGYSQAQPGYGAPQLTNQMAGMNLGGLPRAGDSPLLTTFTHGNVLILQSNASGKSLRINQDGMVQGIGGRGAFAQFRVHVRRPGVVALQNVKNPENWLAIFQGKTIGTGKGGPYGEFTVNEVEGGRYACLESTQYPGQYVGILPDGTVKLPENTRTGQHGRFIVSVHSYAQSGPPPQSAPPPQPQYQPQGHYPPPAQPQYQPQGQYPPAPQPTGPTAPPPQQQQYYPQQQQAPLPQMPAGPQAPTGYKVLDAFQGGNHIQLIARTTGCPLTVNRGAFSTGRVQGVQLGNNDCLWRVVVPSGCSPGTIMLQNVRWEGMYIAIRKKGKVEQGHGKKFCHFKPLVQADNYVSFLSVEHDNNYLAFSQLGCSVDTREYSGIHQETQFFVRVDKQTQGHSETIMTPFGRPSIANQLRDGCVIQLYLKSNNHYLSINGNGIVQNIVNGNDKNTFFKLSDRGMGIVSLNTYKYPGFRLKMQQGALVGKGAADLASDFRLKENHDGTVCFESVIQGGSYVGMQGPAGFVTSLNVFLVTIQRFGGSETTTKTPLN